MICSSCPAKPFLKGKAAGCTGAAECEGGGMMMKEIMGDLVGEVMILVK